MPVLRFLLKFVLAGGGERRKLENRQRKLVRWFSLVIVLFHLVMISRHLWGMDMLIFQWLHIGLVGALGFMLYSSWKPESKISAESFILVAAMIAILIYHLVNKSRLIEMAEIQLMPNNMDLLVGWLLIALVFEGVRRTIGLLFVLLILGLGAYSIVKAGASFALIGRGLLFQGIGGGMWGVILQLSASIILPIFVFAGIFQASGTSEFLMQIAGRIFSKNKGGAAKMAIVASAGYGMVSGGAASNVAVTGAVTIPAMLRSGFKPSVSGAIESVASTGGGITPPIMANVVFIMAVLTGIPYATIIWKVLPVIFIFYLVLYLQCHWIAIKEGIGGVPVVEPLPISRMIRLGCTFVIPIAVLVVLLMMIFTIQTAFLAAILSLSVLLLITKGATGWRQIIDGIIEGGYNTAWLVYILAAAGIFMEMMGVSGIDMDIVLWSQRTFGDVLFPILVMALLLCFVMGMIGAITISYLLAVMLVVPPIIQAGIPVLAAHMFAYFYSLMAYITPPVCIACFIATRFAKESFWNIGWEAVKFSLPIWILPFVFVYRPELLMIQGNSFVIITVLVIAGSGCVLFAAAIRGMLFNQIGKTERIICLLASVCLLIPNQSFNSIGGLFTALIAVIEVTKWARKKYTSPSIEEA